MAPAFSVPSDGAAGESKSGNAKPSLSLLIPAYNEAATLAAVVERSAAVLRRLVADHEIVLLDDASTDGTAEVMRVLAGTCPGVSRVIVHDRNRGIAFSFEELYRAASKEYLFLIPGDGEYPPEAVERILPLLPEHDIVVCRRIFKNYTPYREFVSSWFRALPRILFGVELHDPGSVKCVRRSLIEEIRVRSTGVFVEAERMIRAALRGARIARVDIRPVPREGGQARGARLSLVGEAALDLGRLWWRLAVLREKP